MKLSIEEALNTGIEAHKAGQFAKADSYYNSILNSHPNHPDANHNKGVLVASIGRMEEALPLFKNALEANSNVAQFWKSYIDTLLKLNLFSEAKAVLSEAKNLGAFGDGFEDLEQWLELKNLAVINNPFLKQTRPATPKNLSLDQAIRLAKKKAGNGDLTEARKIYQDIIDKFPKNKKAIKGLLALSQKKLAKVDKSQDPPEHSVKTLIVLNRQGEFKRCKEEALNLIKSYPNSVVLYNFLGSAHQGLDELEEAVNSFNKALAIKPYFADIYYNLGNALQKQNKHKGAIKAYKKAISIKSSFAAAYNNMGSAFHHLGKLGDAIEAYHKALLIQPDYDQVNHNLGAILTQVRFRKPNSSIQNVIKSILDKQTIVRPSNVAGAALSLLKLDPLVKEFIYESRQNNLSNTFKKIVSNLSDLPLLLKLISVCPIADLELEAGLTALRSQILQTIAENPVNLNILSFQSALALHCFTNEYIYSITSDDLIFLKKLEDLVNQNFSMGEQPSPQSVLCLASFNSLSEYDWSNLIKKTDDLEEVFKRQISEPREENKLKRNIKILDEITDGISSKVRNQYESNPYPRWINLGVGLGAASIEEVADQSRLKLTINAIKQVNAPNILIAGCGTGQHSIGTASRFKNSNVLAVDLSLASLAYAERKTKELGITNIEYMQADILNLCKLNRKFDIIESVGVLHHMEDPMVGWKVLTDSLKVGGLMRIGLYSDLARKPVADVRKNIAASNLPISDDKILSIREKIILSDKKNDKQIKSWKDFYSLSELRDLLFHVQEHRFSILQIKDCLSNLGLDFCGFGESDIISSFLEKHNKSDLYNLDQWELFEKSNPRVFSGMYQFWCQKK